LRRIVITSSQLVSEPGYAMRHTHDYRPHTMYGESKVATERITFAWKNAPCPWVMARPTSIWGPWFDEPYRGFFLTIDRGRYFHQRGVDPRRSFGFVGNCIYQYIKLALAPADQVDGKVFYISDYEAVRVRDWANIIQREMGVSRVREIPVEAIAASARIGDLAKNLGWKNPPITSFRLKNLTSDNIVDANATSNVVGELPYSIEEGVRMTVDWLKKQGLLSPESRGKSVLRARAAQSHAVE
jgi:nucleoside-diphosphate-sugar epimerase